MRARGDICGWRLYGIIDLGYVPPAEIERAAAAVRKKTIQEASFFVLVLYDDDDYDEQVHQPTLI